MEVINELGLRAGAEVFFYSLCRELSRMTGIELTVVTMYDVFDDSFAEIKNLPNVRFFQCHKKSGIDFKAAKELKKIIREVEPDIINTHLSFYRTYFLGHGFRKRDFQLVHTIHNENEAEADFIKKKYLKKGMISFIGIAPSITEIYRKNFNTSRITTIENGIVFPAVTDPLSMKYEFLCIAGFRPQKNHTMLLEAFAEHLKSFPDHRLGCLGGGDLFEETKDYANKLGISQNVDFLGWQNSIDPYIRSSKYSVLASHYEGNPISVLESLSYGVPAIVPAVGGIPDIVHDGINGILYERDDKAGLVAAMKRASETEFDQKKVVESVRPYDIKITAKRYIGLFETLLEQNRN